MTTPWGWSVKRTMILIGWMFLLENGSLTNNPIRDLLLGSTSGSDSIPSSRGSIIIINLLIMGCRLGRLHRLLGRYPYGNQSYRGRDEMTCGSIEVRISFGCPNSLLLPHRVRTYIPGSNPDPPFGMPGISTVLPWTTDRDIPDPLQMVTRPSVDLGLCSEIHAASQETRLCNPVISDGIWID